MVVKESPIVKGMIKRSQGFLLSLIKSDDSY
jgi:hypothetical protein